jgi:hypothetical protein
MKQPYGRIYLVRHLRSGKVYVGQTVRKLKQKWKQHREQTGCRRLNNAIRKYGADGFSIEEIN